MEAFGFGITSGLWDLVARTSFPPARRGVQVAVIPEAAKSGS
jgi:hypothetical protein